MRPLRLPPRLATALKVLVTMLAAWLAFRKIENLRAVAEAALGARWGWLLLCLAMQYAMAVLNAMRWRALVPLAGTPLRKYLYYVFVGHFLNLFLPSAALAEGARVYAFGKRYGDVQKNFAAALFARGTGLAIQLALSATFLAFFWKDIHGFGAGGGFRLDAKPVWIAVAAAAACFGVVALYWRERAKTFLGMLLGYARDLRLLGRVTMLSLLIQACTMLGAYTLFRSITPDIRLWHAAVIPVIIQSLLLLPISIGGIGVREYLNILFYTKLAGIPAEIALTASLLTYIYWIIFAATGGLWMLARRRRAEEPAHEPRIQ